jgi:hypothetical protein
VASHVVFPQVRATIWSRFTSGRNALPVTVRACPAVPGSCGACAWERTRPGGRCARWSPSRRAGSALGIAPLTHQPGRPVRTAHRNWQQMVEVKPAERRGQSTACAYCGVANIARWQRGKAGRAPGAQLPAYVSPCERRHTAGWTCSQWWQIAGPAPRPARHPRAAVLASARPGVLGMAGEIGAGQAERVIGRRGCLSLAARRFGSAHSVNTWGNDRGRTAIRADAVGTAGEAV